LREAVFAPDRPRYGLKALCLSGWPLFLSMVACWAGCQSIDTTLLEGAEQCETGALFCGNACTACPQDGVASSFCQSDRCVARVCSQGFHPCATGCCLWTIEKIASITKPVTHLSLAVDSNNVTHLLYAIEEDLTHMRIEPSAQPQTDVVSYYPKRVSGIQVDSRDQPHIMFVYQEDYSAMLRHGVWSDGQWKLEAIAAVSDGSVSPSLEGYREAFCLNHDLPQAAFLGTDFQYQFGVKSGEQWQTETIPLMDTQMAIPMDGCRNGLDQAMLLFADNPDGYGNMRSVILATRSQPEKWYSRAIAERSSVSFLALRVGSDDTAHLLVGSSKSNSMEYAQVSPEKPVLIEWLANDPQGSIAVDSLQRVFVVRHAKDARKVVFSTRQDGAWQEHTVLEDVDVTTSPTIALDAQGYPILAFFNARRSALMLAR
jgi:hypothetical protein